MTRKMNDGVRWARTKGSYTVEAGFIVSLTMILLMALIFLGLLLRDRLTLYEIGMYYVRVIGEMPENRATSDSMKAEIIRKANEQTFLMKVRKADVQRSGKKIVLSYQASADVYGGRDVNRLLARFLTVQNSVERKAGMTAAEFVRMCRSLVWRGKG